MIKDHYIKILKLIVTGLGSGNSKKAPGTAGSILCFILTYLGLVIFSEPSLFYKILFCLVIFVLGYFSLFVLIKNKEYQHEEDHPSVVIDEFIGLITCYCFFKWTVTSLLIGLIMFRFFDILKPYPISIFDKKKGPLWVMLDDVVAGLIAGIITHFLINLI